MLFLRSTTNQKYHKSSQLLPGDGASFSVAAEHNELISHRKRSQRRGRAAAVSRGEPQPSGWCCDAAERRGRPRKAAAQRGDIALPRSSAPPPAAPPAPEGRRQVEPDSADGTHGRRRLGARRGAAARREVVEEAVEEAALGTRGPSLSPQPVPAPHAEGQMSAAPCRSGTFRLREPL